MTATRSTAAPPERVMELVRAPRSWPQWQPEILVAEGPPLLDAGDVVRGHARLLGFGVQGHSTAVAVAADSFEEDVIVGVRMRVRYEARRHDRNTVLTRRLVAELPWGPAGRVLSFFLRRRLLKMQESVVAELVRRAERSP